MSYQRYGISDELVKRIKLKMKNPGTKERMRMVVKGLTKNDLQDRIKIRKLLNQSAQVLNEKLTGQQSENIVQFIIAQKIDPDNPFHLIKLWGMFR